MRQALSLDLEAAMSLSMDGLDKAKGCLVGALVGDSAGATTKFLLREPTADMVQRALEMHGGGVFGLSPGQTTGAGEFIMALAPILCGALEYPRERVANRYHSWVQSGPFDIAASIEKALSLTSAPKESVADAITEQAAILNKDCPSDAELTRCIPMGIWAVNITKEAAVEAARLDALLTNPDPRCGWAAAAYVLAIRHLLLHPCDCHGAVDAARSCLTGNPDLEAGTVMNWLSEAQHGRSSGHVKSIYGDLQKSFTLAFRKLLAAESYEHGLKSVLLHENDSNAGACLVGGLLGARFGYSHIPRHMTKAVEECDISLGRPRPSWLRAQNVANLSAVLAEGKNPPQIEAGTLELPADAVKLGLKAILTRKKIPDLESRFTRLNQPGKFGVTFQPPLLQIWRPRVGSGLYSFAIQMAEDVDGTTSVSDSWVSQKFIDESGLNLLECKKLASSFLASCVV